MAGAAPAAADAASVEAAAAAACVALVVHVAEPSAVSVADAAAPSVAALPHSPAVSEHSGVPALVFAEASAAPVLVSPLAFPVLVDISDPSLDFLCLAQEVLPGQECLWRVRSWDVRHYSRVAQAEYSCFPVVCHFRL